MMHGVTEDGSQVHGEEDLVMRMEVQVDPEEWRVGRLVGECQ